MGTIDTPPSDTSPEAEPTKTSRFFPDDDADDDERLNPKPFSDPFRRTDTSTEDDILDFSKTLTSHEMTAFAAVVDAASRAKLTGTDRVKFYNSAVIGIDTKISLKDSFTADIADNDGFFSTQLDFGLLVKRIQERIFGKCMHSVFTLRRYALNSFGLPNSIQTGANLFTSYSIITEEEVKESNRIYRTHATRTLELENLAWSHTFLINSCDDELRRVIDSKLMGFDDMYHGGPLTFLLIVQQIVTNSDRTARALVTNLQHLQIPSIPGENIDTLAAHILAAVLRLESCNKIPLDIADICLEILDTSSVDVFTRHFQTLKTVRAPLLKNYRELLTEATRLYSELLHLSQWVPLSKSNKSSFMGQAHTHERLSDKPKETGRKPIDRTPPKKGAPTKRQAENGREESWCSTCERWGNHLSDGHDQWRADMKAYWKRKKEGRTDKDKAAPTDTPSPGTAAVAATTTTPPDDTTPGVRFSAASNQMASVPRVISRLRAIERE